MSDEDLNYMDVERCLGELLQRALSRRAGQCQLCGQLTAVMGGTFVDGHPEARNAQDLQWSFACPACVPVSVASDLTRIPAARVLEHGTASLDAWYRLLEERGPSGSGASLLILLFILCSGGQREVKEEETNALPSGFNWAIFRRNITRILKVRTAPCYECGSEIPVWDGFVYGPRPITRFGQVAWLLACCACRPVPPPGKGYFRLPVKSLLGDEGSWLDLWLALLGALEVSDDYQITVLLVDLCGQPVSGDTLMQEPALQPGGPH